MPTFPIRECDCCGQTAPALTFRPGVNLCVACLSAADAAGDATRAAGMAFERLAALESAVAALTERVDDLARETEPERAMRLA